MFLNSARAGFAARAQRNSKNSPANIAGLFFTPLENIFFEVFL